MSVLKYCVVWNFWSMQFILIKNKNNKKDVTSWRGDVTYMYISCYKRCILNFIFLVIQRNLIKFWIRNKILIGWILMYHFIQCSAHEKHGELCDVTFGSALVHVLLYGMVAVFQSLKGSNVMLSIIKKKSKKSFRIEYLLLLSSE